MAARWDIAAVIVALLAIFFTASPVAVAWLQHGARALLCCVWKDRGRCRRILWSDINEGYLHQCDHCGSHATLGRDFMGFWLFRCPLPTVLHYPINCWENSIGVAFNKTWSTVKTNLANANNTVNKPFQLPVHVDYIQTDAQTLKAFIILTASSNFDTVQMDARTFLEVEHSGPIAIVHLKTPKLIYPTMTKSAMELILEGYPPFFRPVFNTTGNIEVSHPITDASQIGRGAWVLAVGMTITEGTVCQIYNMQKVTHETTEVFWKGTLVMSAFRMIGYTLAQLKVFEDGHSPQCLERPPENSLWTDHAFTCFDKIMSSDYSSQPWYIKLRRIEESILFKSVVGDRCRCTGCIDVNHYSPECLRGQHLKKHPARVLTKEQCTAALKIFNNIRHSIENLETIWPVFPQILQTLILGMFEVEHYFSNIGQNLEFPKELEAKQYIYLRHCVNPGRA